MDRQALLLYLQNVRDLEVARYQAAVKEKSLKGQYEPKINSISVEPALKPVPQFEKEISSTFGLSCAIVAVCGFFLLLLFLDSKFSGETMNFPLSVLLVIVMLGFAILAVDNIPETEEQFYKRKSEEIEWIKGYNWQQQTKALQAASRREELRLKWQEEDKALKNSYRQATETLNSFYSMNIIPNQYRNLASMIYIYDYMSSSQASFEDTLMHEHMENGIQRLEARLNSIIGGLDDLIYETRCIREDNRFAVERVIAQNNHMLDVLKSAANSAQEAAQYAELSSNYSKANAYFSLANYLK